MKPGSHRTALVIFMVLLCVALLPYRGWAGLIYSTDFTSTDDGTIKIVGGEIHPTVKGPGWRSAAGEDGPSGYGDPAHYIELPDSVIDPKGGALRFVLVRSDNGVEQRDIDYEAVLALVDENNAKPLLIRVVWENLSRKHTELQIRCSENPKRDGLWDYSIPLGRTVSVGQSVEFLLTWGVKKNQNKLFVDGKEINFTYEKDQFYTKLGAAKTFADYVEGMFTRVLIGTEPYPDPYENRTNNWSPLNDTVLSEIEFRGPPSIRSVNHDAFAVAGYSGKLVEGDKFHVILEAEPGGTATFDLVQLESTSKGVTTPEKVRISGHEMTEDSDNPGTYRGVHIVKYGENVKDGQIIGRFSNPYGMDAKSLAAAQPLTMDTKIYLAINPSNDLVPADRDSRAGITIKATDANGKAVRQHPLKLTMSTTDEYTGTVGGGTFEDQVGGSIEVDWKGVTDSFGEVTAQYVSGFAAKTILVSAKDMETGDVGVGYVRSFIDGTVDIVVKSAAARALAVAGSMEVTASRGWLTADGQSRSRITAVVKDASGNPVQGDSVRFNLLGGNGTIRVIRARTDSRGRAVADYIAGTKVGLVQIQVQDITSGLSALVQIELRPDAPAEIALSADPPEVFTDGATGSVITAKVSDINGNPNLDTEVLFELVAGTGSVSSPSVLTDGSAGREGVAEVTYLPGSEPGVATVRATVMSRHATSEEIAAAEGAVFLYGLDEEPRRLEVLEWLAEPEDEVVEGQELVVLEDRDGTQYRVKAPREGTLATFVAEVGDRVEYGQTLGYVLPLTE